MKLLTLNVHAWQEENQLDKIYTLAKAINEKEYDVIALQEVSQHRESPIHQGSVRSDNYALLLQQALASLGNNNYELEWVMSHYGYEVYEEGLALLTKLPVDEYHQFYITSSTSIDFWKSRNIVGATMHIEDKDIAVYSCHLGWWDDLDESYEKQVDTLLQHVSPATYTFLMGDFNAASSTNYQGYDYILSKGVKDTHSIAATQTGQSTVEGKIAGWDSNQGGVKIDYIFSLTNVNVTSSSIIFNGTHYPILSDHYGVEVEVTLN
ncbi:endonuclease/exonuclease/phosphatase family protein [Pontibacillus salicampi]|uniref:Endonuclease/exonuclease/phosphatase family protein n=1 Tax=Pontibacillus salicampi TaxID=1449801 RepID=A0ABV6LL87_9BACI